MNSISKSALTAGISLVIMTAISFVVLMNLEVSVFSIVGISVIILLDLIVAVALYFLFRSTDKNLAMLTSALRVIYAVFFITALINISDLQTFYAIWDFGLLIFGIHLFFVGLLTYRSSFLPTWLGILVFITAFGYLFDGVMMLFGSSFEIGMFTFFGEIVFALWLLVMHRQFSAKTEQKN